MPRGEKFDLVRECVVVLLGGMKRSDGMFSFEINIEISESISPIDVINTTIHEIGHALTQYFINVI